MTPIHKSGSKADISNYRPVCILSAIPKLFENLITKYLTSLLGRTIIDEQFGFQRGRSTELNLITYVDYLSSVLDKGGVVHSIYTDFSKAFDRVNHTLLLKKLEAIGVSGAFLDWITGYLSDRSQIVKVNNFRSYEVMVPSGVPQGSHLGPLLFNIFINDIGHCFKHCKFLCFADDLKLYLAVSSVDDCRRLQSDLARLEKWCEANGMDLNASKCHNICFTRSRNPIRFDYVIGDTVLSRTSAAVDLGVTVDSSLSFVPHIDGMVSRALGMLGFVKRSTSDFRSVSAIRLLYCSLVRPLLEYASSVWNPYYACHIHKIEQVQRRFLRYLSFKANINPPDDFHYDYDMLQNRFSLETLRLRRNQRDLKQFFKILNSLVDCPSLLNSIGLAVPSRNTRSTITFHQPFYRTNYGFNSFIPRASKLANCSPNDLDFFGSYKSFLRHI